MIIDNQKRGELEVVLVGAVSRVKSDLLHRTTKVFQPRHLDVIHDNQHEILFAQTKLTGFPLELNIADLVLSKR